jgi:hypothetical protein
MSEITDTQREAIKGAIDKINEGLQEYLDAIADEGEPEVAQSAVVLFESHGMAEAGIFERISFVLLQQTHRTQMLGMLEIAGEKLDHTLRCSGHEE